MRERSRREFLTTLGAFGLSVATPYGSLLAHAPLETHTRQYRATTFRVWVFADAHVGTDKKQGRESLADALRQSELASGFDWDIALDLGDMSGEQGTPKDPEGEEIVRQFGVLKQHRR